MSMTATQECPVCHGESRFENGFDDIRLYRCRRCDHIYTDVTALARVEDYSSDYFHDTHRNWNENPFTWLFERIAKVIESGKAGGSILDLGCGRGELLRYLHKRLPESTLTGIDLSATPGRNGIEYHRGDFLAYDLGRIFDVLVSVQAIEHAVDIHRFTERVRSLVRPGGLVIISTINERSISYDVAKLFNTLGYRVAYQRLFSRHHLHHFNISSLRALLSGDGFEIVETIRHNEPLAAVDMPDTSALVKAVLKTGVWGTFALGQLTGRTVLQTVVCRRSG